MWLKRDHTRVDLHATNQCCFHLAFELNDAWELDARHFASAFFHSALVNASGRRGCVSIYPHTGSIHASIRIGNGLDANKMIATDDD